MGNRVEVWFAKSPSYAKERYPRVVGPPLFYRESTEQLSPEASYYRQYRDR